MFREKVGVVTGGAQGLGQAIVRLLVERGAFVHVIDDNQEKLSSLVAALEGSVHGHVADVADETRIIDVRRAVVAFSGRVDVVVNNAGIYPFEGTRDITVESWDRMFDVNLKGTFLITRVFADDLIANGEGRVVCIASTDSYIPKPLYPHYAASKAAVRSLVKTFALELARHGVLVNAVSPGSIAMPNAHAQGWLPQAIKRIPLGRAAEPEDIAEVVAFLVSSANRFICGETLIASGGEIMD